MDSFRSIGGFDVMQSITKSSSVGHGRVISILASSAASIGAERHTILKLITQTEID